MGLSRSPLFSLHDSGPASVAPEKESALYPLGTPRLCHRTGEPAGWSGKSVRSTRCAGGRAFSGRKPRRLVQRSERMSCEAPPLDAQPASVSPPQDGRARGPTPAIAAGRSAEHPHSCLTPVTCPGALSPQGALFTLCWRRLLPATSQPHPLTLRRLPLRSLPQNHSALALDFSLLPSPYPSSPHSSRLHSQINISVIPETRTVRKATFPFADRKPHRKPSGPLHSPVHSVIQS